MQRVTMVRYTAKSEKADENETLARAVFAELKIERPKGVAYALFRNGAEFVHVFVNLRDDESAAITELPTFKAYAKDVTARSEAPPEATRLSLNLLDAYGFAG